MKLILSLSFNYDKSYTSKSYKLIDKERLLFNSYLNLLSYFTYFVGGSSIFGSISVIYQ